MIIFIIIAVRILRLRNGLERFNALIVNYLLEILLSLQTLHSYHYIVNIQSSNYPFLDIMSSKDHKTSLNAL